MKIFGYWIIKDEYMQRHFRAGEVADRVFEARRWFHPYKQLAPLFEYLVNRKIYIDHARKDVLNNLGIKE